MLAFPSAPVSPKVFFEETVPALFLEAGVGPEDRERVGQLKFGVVLIAGEEGTNEGGQWTLQIIDGELVVSIGRCADCDLTIVQDVADWRSALWEGRPRLIADGIEMLASAEPAALLERREGMDRAHPEALKGLSDLQGLIEAVIAEEEPASAAADWRIGIHLGRGPIPESPQATIRLGAEQAEAIRDGGLHPVEALITGQLRLEGDLGLILQLQAVAMLVMMPPPTSG